MHLYPVFLKFLVVITAFENSCPRASNIVYIAFGFNNT